MRMYSRRSQNRNASNSPRASYNGRLFYEVLMSLSICPDRRFPICCPVNYYAGLREGHGHVWNLSVNGLRFSAMCHCELGRPVP
jgi:hypothetical protein